MSWKFLKGCRLPGDDDGLSRIRGKSHGHQDLQGRSIEVDPLGRLHRQPLSQTGNHGAAFKTPHPGQLFHHFKGAVAGDVRRLQPQVVSAFGPIGPRLVTAGCANPG